MKRVNSNVLPVKQIVNNPFIKSLKLRVLLNLTVGLFYSLYVKLIGGWGFQFYFFIVYKATYAFIRGKITIKQFNDLISLPMDSFRYFEFHYGLRFIESIRFGNYMDVSSPRFFPAFLINKFDLLNPVLVNPDVKDINYTKWVYEKIGLCDKIIFHNKLLEQLDVKGGQFDLITSISVLEHIPMDTIENAIDKIYELLKPGGYLLVSVPVAKEAFNEFINVNDYGLQNETMDGYYFGQRFHDNHLINLLFLRKNIKMMKIIVAGESVNGFFTKNRLHKTDPHYPFFKEPYIFFKNFKLFESIDSLPGIGVAVILLQKQN